MKCTPANQNYFDTIIIGAGPAGLAAAIRLSKKKREVIVIEKNKDIGPKICAGALTTKDFELGVPAKMAEKSFNKLYLHTPLQTSVVENKKPFISIVDRTKLGKWMSKKAKDQGVNIICDQLMDLDQKNSTITLKSKRKLKYNYLIAADGSNSLIRQKLGVPKKKVLISQQYLVNKVFNKIELFIDVTRFGPWYLWIFPHKNFTSIGTGCDPKIFPFEKSKENFLAWLKEHKVDLTDAKYEEWTINYDCQKFEYGNIFLVGDAAGFTSGLTGEGIYFAMVSGIEASKKIINPGYKLNGIKSILQIKRNHERLLSSLEFCQTFSAIEMEIASLLTKMVVFNKKIIRTYM